MERDNISEKSTNFPSFSAEDMQYVIRRLGSDQERLRLFRSMVLDELILAQFVDEFSRFTPNPNDFKRGAYHAYSSFVSFRDRGYVLPPVEQTTLDNFLAEFETGVRQTGDSLISADPSSLASEFEKLRPSVEFNYPHPSLYVEENPHLMNWWLTSFPPYGQIGAAVIYDLKRRQFHINALRQQFKND